MRADGGYHDVMKAYDLIRRKAPIGEPVRGICLANRKEWQFYLFETVILHRPEHIAPGRIQRPDRRVAFGAPYPKCIARRWRCAERCVVAA